MITSYIPAGKQTGTRKHRTQTIQAQGRLYRIAFNKYIQHCSPDPEPQELLNYSTNHGGDLPPCILLPVGPTEFHLGADLLHWVARQWSGTGPIPADVMRYVVDNGCLPPHEAGRISRGHVAKQTRSHIPVAA